MPGRSDLDGDWQRRTFETHTRPGDTGDSAACAKADDLYGFDPPGSVERALVGLRSEQADGLYLYFFAHEDPDDAWAMMSNPNHAARFYGELAVAQCFAESMAGDRASDVTVQSVRPSSIGDTNAVAWRFLMEGEDTVLRWESHAWRQGPLLLVVQGVGSEVDVTQELLREAVETFRARAEEKIPR